MEVILSSETLVHIRTTQSCISEDGNFHNYRFEDFKSYLIKACYLRKETGSNSQNSVVNKDRTMDKAQKVSTYVSFLDVH
jgi:hypothetical protein